MNIEYNVYWDRRSERKTSQYVRVVKEADSKSAGFSRAGSNPAADVFLSSLFFTGILHSFTILLPLGICAKLILKILKSFDRKSEIYSSLPLNYNQILSLDA